MEKDKYLCINKDECEAFDNRTGKVDKTYLANCDNYISYDCQV